MAAVAAILLMSRRDASAAVPGVAYSPEFLNPQAPPDFEWPSLSPTVWDYQTPFDWSSPMPIDLPFQNSGDATFPGDYSLDVPAQPDYLRAVLYAIRSAENADRRFSDSDRYRIFYGQSFFNNLTDHPVNTGEKVGVKLSDSMCANAGFSPGCVSTAAGAYQIIRPTWDRVRKPGAWGPRLPDFGRDSQDEAARRLLIESGAMPFILNGDIESAFSAASPVWASLPGSTAKQGGRSMPQMIALYNQGLIYG